MSAAVTARWDGFLAQVRERFMALMEEAKVGCPQLLEQADFDSVPMGNAWGAIENRASQLSSKITDTWDSQVDGAFEQAGAPPQAIAHERAKGNALRDFMEIERERTRIAIFADAGRRLFDRALAEGGRSFGCSRCGSPIQVPFTFRALNMTCGHCSTVNGFEPGTRMRMGESWVHPMCEEISWEQWLALKQAERARRDHRGESFPILKQLERAHLAFLHAYLSARIRFLPDTAPAFDADFRGRMRFFYEQLDREAVWIQAGRPRELV